MPRRPRALARAPALHRPADHRARPGRARRLAAASGRSPAASASSAGGRSLVAVAWHPRARCGSRAKRRTNSSGLQRRPARGDAALRDPARLRRDGRHLLRALGRREHRPRGDDARWARSSGSWCADKTGSWELGLLGAMARRRRARARSTLSSRIHLRADQIVSGTAVNFLALGMTGYLFRSTSTGRAGRRVSRAIPDIRLPLLEDIPFIGDVYRPAEPDDLADASCWCSSPASSSSGRRSGLRMRSVGEHPRAADTVGISVFTCATRPSSPRACSPALGGAYLSFGFGGTFNENMTRRPRLHRPRGDDLRQLAAVRRLRRLPAVRLLDGPRDRLQGSPPFRPTSPPATCSRRCRTSSRWSRSWA